ncbi:hypothetical protein MKW98_023158 [Papaver atlanticum]|uniref:Uncharacterized protein n=1 Tax=Papaver atlanticum TaxID=357466 RepID=A0AAD4TAC7_9MAGN|nr:hypothetical protein MKW98_023158 [Papaver atlanticum]
MKDHMGRPVMTAIDDTNPWWEAIVSAGGTLTKPEILRAGIPTFGFSPMRNTPILLHEHNYLEETVYTTGIKISAH